MLIRNFLILLAFLFAGEIIHRVLRVPLSGPLIGMVLLLLAMLFRKPDESFQATTRPLLASLALLFVPAGVGMVNHVDLLQRYWLPVLVATVVGAIASLLVTAWTMQLIERIQQSAGAEQEAGDASPVVELSKPIPVGEQQ